MGVQQGLEYFISRAKIVHNNKYDYSLWTSYFPSVQNYHGKIPVICQVHGSFEIRLSNHLQGRGCPTCGKIKASKKLKKGKEYFIEKARKIHNNKYDYSLWADDYNKIVRIGCPEHGEFDQSIENHVNKKAGCPKCSSNKRKQYFQNRFDVDHPKQFHMVKSLPFLENKDWLYDEHFIKQKPLSEIAINLGVQDTTIGRYFRKHNLENIRFPISMGEKQLGKFLTDSNIKIETNISKIIPSRELDIFIPEFNIAIEYCGLYWHSDKHKSKWYHFDKMKACSQVNIRLLTIFEDEWVNKKEIVERKLKYLLKQDNSLKISANKTNLISLDRNEKNVFFKKHHIQGTGPGSITYGLQYNNDVVAAMTFIERGTSFILNRYATSCIVRGGFLKLLEYFKNHHKYTEIITFADLRWSNGQLYQQSGFTLETILPVDYYYTDGHQRWHKFGFRRKLLQNKLNKFDPNLSEAENCRNAGLYKIWNCGLNKYVLRHEKIYC